MTPKEKAAILFHKMYKLDNREWYNIAKQCALIAVDEILKSVPKYPSRSITMPHFEANVYWEEVKSEIEKL